MKNETEQYEVGGKSYPVETHIRVRDAKTNEIYCIPVIDVPLESDYFWHISALATRIINPKSYEAEENVSEKVECLRKKLFAINPDYEKDLQDQICKLKRISVVRCK